MMPNLALEPTAFTPFDVIASRMNVRAKRQIFVLLLGFSLMGCGCASVHPTSDEAYYSSEAAPKLTETNPHETSLWSLLGSFWPQSP